MDAEREKINTLVCENFKLAKKMAGRYSLTTGRDFDSCLSDALMGLFKAARTFNENFGTRFATFATHRIVGEMRDGLRANLGTKRKDYRPTIPCLDIEDDRGNTMADSLAADEVSSIEVMIGQENFSKLLLGLGCQAKAILTLYFVHEWNMKEIGQALKLCESRVSQIMGQSLEKLDRILREKLLNKHKK